MNPFKTKTALLNFLKTSLNNLPHGTRITSGSLFEALTIALNSHPSALVKKGTGVDYFTTGPCRVNPSNSVYYIVRKDGSIINFSYRKAVTGVSAFSHEKKVKKAFRHAIRYQLVAFKQDYFSRTKSVKCPESGLYISLNDSHVDHLHPHTFEEILSDFFKERGLSFSDIKVVNATGSDHVLILDESILASWKKFHKEKSLLAVVHPSVNLGRKRR